MGISQSSVSLASGHAKRISTRTWTLCKEISIPILSLAFLTSFSPSPFSCFLRTGGRGEAAPRLLHSSLQAPVSQFYLSLWFRCFHFLPFLHLGPLVSVPWVDFHHPIRNNTLFLLPASLGTLGRKPQGSCTPQEPAMLQRLWQLHPLSELPFCLNSFHCSLLISNSMIH